MPTETERDRAHARAISTADLLAELEQEFGVAAPLVDELRRRLHDAGVSLSQLDEVRVRDALCADCGHRKGAHYAEVTPPCEAGCNASEDGAPFLGKRCRCRGWRASDVR